MRRLIGGFLVLAAGFVVSGCSQDPELAPDDPANCDVLQAEAPEHYEKCLEELEKIAD